MIPMTSTSAGMPTSVPAFIAKLWHMVSDEKCDDLICWSDDGTSFVIKDQARFCSQLLPRYYKHNNMASFIRQLNKYGFHKVSSIESSTLRNEKGDFEFAHEFFVRGCIRSLEMIKRKMTATSREIVDIKGDMAPLLQQLLLQVQELKDNHESFESKIASMKRENDALWREHSILRQKYVKQNKMINQLIQFLATLVQQTRSVSVNRSRSQPIILRQDLSQVPLMAIEAKKKDSPVICELDSLDADTNLAGKFVVDGEEPTISNQTYLIHSPLDQVIGDQHEPIALTIPESPLEPETTIEVAASPGSLLWQNIPTGESSGVGSLNGDQSSPFNLDSPTSSRAHLVVCPQDVTPAIITRGATPRQSSSTPRQSDSTPLQSSSTPRQSGSMPRQSSSAPCESGSAPRQSGSKKTVQTNSKNNGSFPNVAVKQEKLDPLLTTGIPDLTAEDPLLTNDAIDPNTKKTKRKEPGSSLVLSDGGTRPDFETHLDVVQSDLDSLKDILQGLDTSAFMSLFSEQDPLGLNMSDAGNSNNQQLVSMNPGFMDISDLLAEEEVDPLSLSPVPSVDGMDSILNTPQPTHLDSAQTAQPTFSTPKRAKK